MAETTIEQRQAERRAMCTRQGHDFDVVTVPWSWPDCAEVMRLAAAEPVFVACERCGENWDVTRRDEASP